MEDYLSELRLNFLVSSHLPDTGQRGMLVARESLENELRQLPCTIVASSTAEKIYNVANEIELSDFNVRFFKFIDN